MLTVLNVFVTKTLSKNHSPGMLLPSYEIFTMKKILTVVLLLLTGIAFAQNEAVIRRDFESIVQYTRQKKIDKVIDMTYPPLFKIMPKAQMKAMANGALAGMGVTMIFEEKPLNLKLSPVKTLASATVCMGSYYQSTIMEVKNPALIDMMAKTKMQGATIEKLSANKLRMRGTQYLLAIKDTYTGNTWKYLRYDDEDAGTNAKVLSKEILSAAVQLKSNLNK